MTDHAAELIREGLALDPDQRAIVANTLLDSIHAGQASSEVADAWHVEAAERLREIRAGAVEAVDADEHYARLRASITRSS